MHAQRTKKPLTALGKLIVGRLAELHKTQVWLADELEISKQGLSKWLYGGDSQEAQVKRANAARLAKVLQFPLERVHQALGDPARRPQDQIDISVDGDPVRLTAAEAQVVLTYRDADPKDRRAVRIILGIEETDPSSDPRYPRGAAPPAARFIKSQR